MKLSYYIVMTRVYVHNYMYLNQYKNLGELSLLHINIFTIETFKFISLNKW